MKKLLIILFFTLTFPVFSGTRHSGGLKFSTYSGSGLNYTYRINKDWYWELTGAAFFLQGTDGFDQELHIIFGSELQYSFYRNGDHRIYSLIGLSTWYVERSVDITNVINDREITDTKYSINRMFNAGIGLGYETKIFEKVFFSVDVGLQYQISEPFLIGELIDRDLLGEEFLGFGFGSSIKYRF